MKTRSGNDYHLRHVSLGGILVRFCCWLRMGREIGPMTFTSGAITYLIAAMLLAVLVVVLFPVVQHVVWLLLF